MAHKSIEYPTISRNTKTWAVSFMAIDQFNDPHPYRFDIAKCSPILLFISRDVANRIATILNVVRGSSLSLGASLGDSIAATLGQDPILDATEANVDKVYLFRDWVFGNRHRNVDIDIPTQVPPVYNSNPTVGQYIPDPDDDDDPDEMEITAQPTHPQTPGIAL